MNSIRSSYEVLVHIVWSTKYRQRIIRPDLDAPLAEFMRRKAIEHGCELLGVGFDSDHAHVAASLSSRCALATLVQGLKGASSRIHNRDRAPGEPKLYWQDCYWAESFAPRSLPAIVEYCRTQRAHHARGAEREAWQRCLFPVAE
jgi:putative transposase